MPSILSLFSISGSSIRPPADPTDFTRPLPHHIDNADRADRPFRSNRPVRPVVSQTTINYDTTVTAPPVILPPLPPSACPLSPSGSHHWIFESSGKSKTSNGVCKYCQTPMVGSNVPPVIKEGRLKFDVVFQLKPEVASRIQRGEL